MKILKILFYSTSSYAAITSSAHADPISLTFGSAIFSSLYAIGVPGAIANFIAVNGLSLVAAAAAVAVGLAGGEVSAAVNTANAKSTFETGESSIVEGVGRVRVGGLKAFGNTDGSTRGRLVCRLQGPIDAIEAHYLGQREVTVETNGDVSSPPWARPGGSWCNWQNKIGDGSETAWAGLMSLFPDLWTSAHRARGIAQSQLLFYNPGLSEEKYLSLYQGGVPDSEWIARASLVYDPRDPSQSVDSPLTWKWSETSILILAHALRRDPAFNSSRFNWTRIAEQADKADELVVTKTGTEKRSRLWGMWQWEATRSETMQKFLDSAGAEIRMDDDGLIWFELIDDAIIPEIDFSPADIYNFECKEGPDAVERPNICRLSYYSPEQLYEVAEINLEGIAWAQIDEEVDRYGPKYSDIELSFCPSASQAQRVGRRLFEIARASTGTLTTNMVGLAAWGLFYAQVEEPYLGDLTNVRMDPPRIDDQNGQVEIPFKVWPTLTAWDPETDEADAPDVIPEMGYETDMITPDPPSSAIQITYPDSSKELRIGYSLPAQDYDTIEANYRTYTSGLPNTWQSMAEYNSTSAGALGNLIGQTVDARVRVFNGDDGTYFSDVANLTVVANNTAPSAPTVTGGVETGPIRLQVTAKSSQIQVAAIRLQRKINSGSFTTVQTLAVQPEAQVSFTDNVTSTSSGTITTWQIQALTSDGTAGTAVTYSYTAP